MIERFTPVFTVDRGSWFKSTHSSSAAGCVEVKFDTDLVFVRDSKDRRARQPVVGVPIGGWVSFLDTVRR
ncbi:hypothetical protein GCM10027436_30220 [Actinophytocola sediminis]